jgi:YQGE family putative transporter
MGVASSLYWANRDFLALASTTDENRNYYYGLETFFATNTNIVVPMAVGTFIGWYGGEQVEKVLGAYRIVTGLVFVLAMMASVLVQKGGFRNPPATRFIYLRYHWIWNRMQVMSIIKGIGDGYLVTAPAMLVMTLVGKEGSLGTLLSAGGVISAVMLYILGRTTKPKHRIWLMTIGMSVFLLGALANAILFSAAGVLVFMVLFVLSRPLTDIAAYPIYLLAIDTAAAAEKRNQYSHVMSREFACYIGRAGGCLLFILLAYGISNQFALRYALLMVALLQLLVIPVALTIIRGCDAYWRGVAASTAGTVPLSDESPATISK